MINSGREWDWIEYEGKRKKLLGVHTNGNYLVKMNGNLVQLPKEKCKYE
ncbi:MAG: hypothetical protein ACKVK4_08050 [Flavobacteriales bacterium]|tara:strand:- start:988 stop:1134 length:147 start_codon:yes stop_codon:yes gene_type:complete